LAAAEWLPSSTAPASCRALIAKGITGKLAMYSLGGSTPRLMVDIKRGAGLTIEEGASGMRLASRRAPPDASQLAISSVAVRSAAARGQSTGPA
jgi:hypothetical protein